MTFHRSKAIQKNFEANRKEKRSVTTNKNRNIETDTTHPHVFSEISNASRLSFPLEEGDGTSAGVKPIVLTSVNGYADLRIPTVSDLAPASNVDLRQEIASANAGALLTSTPDFNTSPPLQVLISSTPPLQAFNNFTSPPLQDLNVLTDNVSSASQGVVRSNENPSDLGHESVSVVVKKDIAETIPKVVVPPGEYLLQVFRGCHEPRAPSDLSHFSSPFLLFLVFLSPLLSSLLSPFVCFFSFSFTVPFVLLLSFPLFVIFLV